jgi:hypothetical protein
MVPGAANESLPGQPADSEVSNPVLTQGRVQQNELLSVKSFLLFLAIYFRYPVPDIERFAVGKQYPLPPDAGRAPPQDDVSGGVLGLAQEAPR